MLASKENVVEFTIALPKAKPGREIDALPGSKDSPKTYGKFKASG